MRRAACFSLFAFASLISIPAVAQSWGARLVRVLDKVGRADLVADSSGRVHASAILPHGVSAKSLGLVPFDVDTASLRGTPAEIIAFGEQHPEVEISVGPPLRPLLDKSKAWTHAADFVNQTGFNGTGVVVGVIDTGIDILHPDFRDKNGKTRIKWLLQTGIPSVGKHADMEAKYCEFLKTTCAVFDADQIDALITEAEATGADPPNTGGTYDSSGHGTHVASIAAGNGGVMKGTPKYVGVAPGADLVIAAPQSFQDDDVGWAAQFIFDRADDMKEPCSVNVSLGSDYGAHDGSDILDRRLSRFVGDDRPGHAITVAAGNSGGLYLFPKEDTPWGIHTETTVYPDTDVRVPIYAPVANAGRG